MVVIKTEKFDDTLRSRIDILALNQKWKLVLKGSYKFKSFGYVISDIDFSVSVKYTDSLRDAILRVLNRVKNSKDFVFIYMTCGYYDNFEVPWNIFEAECFFNYEKTLKWYKNRIETNANITDVDKNKIHNLLFADKIIINNLITVEEILDGYFEMKWTYEDIYNGYKIDPYTGKKYELVATVSNNVTVLKFGYLVYDQNNILSDIISIDERLLEYNLPDGKFFYNYYRQNYYKIFNGYKWILSSSAVDNISESDIKNMYELEISKIQYENSIINSIDILSRLIKYYKRENAYYIDNLAKFIYRDLQLYIPYLDNINNFSPENLKRDNSIRKELVKILKDKIHERLSSVTYDFVKYLNNDAKLLQKMSFLKAKYAEEPVNKEKILERSKRGISCPFFDLNQNDFEYLYQIAYNNNMDDPKDFLDWIIDYILLSNDTRILEMMRNEDFRKNIIEIFHSKNSLIDNINSLYETHKESRSMIRNRVFKKILPVKEHDYKISYPLPKLFKYSNFSEYFGFDSYIKTNIVYGILKNIDDNSKLVKIGKQRVITGTKTSRVFASELIVGKSVYPIVIKYSTKKVIGKDTLSFDYYIKEYIIGKFYINKLRYFCPNFMNTYYLYRCPNDIYNQALCTKLQVNTPFIVIEKVEGSPMIEYIKRQQSFSDWLITFVQILCALEIAQQKYNFVHRDLHTKNIMISSNPTMVNYSIKIGNDKITFKNLKYYPKIIDFGLSQIHYDIPELDEDAKVFNKGYDVYYLLIYTMNACYNRIVTKDLVFNEEIMEEQYVEKIDKQMINPIWYDIRNLTNYLFEDNIESYDDISKLISERLSSVMDDSRINITPYNIMQKILFKSEYSQLLLENIEISKTDVPNITYSPNYNEYINDGIISLDKCKQIENINIIDKSFFEYIDSIMNTKLSSKL